MPDLNQESPSEGVSRVRIDLKASLVFENNDFHLLIHAPDDPVKQLLMQQLRQRIKEEQEENGRFLDIQEHNENDWIITLEV